MREEYLLFGFPHAQFLKTAVQQKGAVLRLGYSDTICVLTIYVGNPELPVGKSIGSRHFVWEPS